MSTNTRMKIVQSTTTIRKKTASNRHLSVGHLGLFRPLHHSLNLSCRESSMAINRSMAKPMESSADSNAIVTLISSTSPSFLSRLSILEADSLRSTISWQFCNVRVMRMWNRQVQSSTKSMRISEHNENLRLWLTALFERLYPGGEVYMSDYEATAWSFLP